MGQVLNQALNKKNNFPLIILIGGVFSVGKTTLSYNLSNFLIIKQRASLGLITKTMRSLGIFPSKERLFDLLEEEDFNFLVFEQRSKKICEIVNSILQTARKDGVDYILDGVQLFPKYLDLKQNTFYIYLKAPSEAELFLRLKSSKTHTKRYKKITVNQVKKLLNLDNYMLSLIKNRKNIIVIDSSLNEEQILKEALSKINKTFN